MEKEPPETKIDAAEAILKVDDIIGLVQFCQEYAPALIKRLKGVTEVETGISIVAKELNIKMDDSYAQLVCEVDSVSAEFSPAGHEIKRMSLGFKALINALTECEEHTQQLKKCQVEFERKTAGLLQDVQAGSSNVLVLGDTSSGKSTLCNVLIGARVLPMCVPPCTTTICEVKYGAKKQALAYRRPENWSDVEPEPEKFDLEGVERPDKLLEKSLHFRDFDEWPPRYTKVSIEWPSPLLKSGLVLVDSPGVSNDADARNRFVAEEIKKYLPNCAAILFVFNSSVGSVTDEFADLIQAIAGAFSTLKNSSTDLLFQSDVALFVANKWDEVAKNGPEEEKRTLEALNKVIRTKWLLKPTSVLNAISQREQILTMVADKSLKSVLENMPSPPTFKTFATKFAGALRTAFRGRFCGISVKSEELLIQIIKILRSKLLAQFRTVERNTYLKAKTAKLSQDWSTIKKHFTQEVDKMNSELICQLERDILGKDFDYVAGAAINKVTAAKHYNIEGVFQKIHHHTATGLASYLSSREDKNKEFDKLASEVLKKVEIELREFVEELEGFERCLFGVTAGGNGLSAFQVTGIAALLIVGVPIAVALSVASAAVGLGIGLLSIVPILMYIPVKFFQDSITLNTYESNSREFTKQVIFKLISRCLENAKIKNYDNLLFDKLYEDNFEILTQTLIRIRTQAHSIIDGLTSRVGAVLEKANSLEILSEDQKLDVQKNFQPLTGEIAMLEAMLAFFTMKYAVADGIIKTTDLTVTRNILGTGGFAVVYDGQLTTPKQEKLSVAVKKPNTQIKLDTSSYFSMFVNEACNLRILKHPNVVYCHGWVLEYNPLGTSSFDRWDISIVMEKCTQSLRDAINRKSFQLNDKTFHKMITDIALGMEFIHSRGFMHRDLKAENVLISLDGTAKIADCGLAKSLNNSTGTFTGTVLYMAPEVTLHCYSKKADVFSFGLLLWEMWYRSLISQPSHEASWKPDFSHQPIPPTHVIKMIGQCCAYEPNLRPTFKKIVEELKNWKDMAEGL